MNYYHKIVFGIKQRYRIDDVLHICRNQRVYSIFISQHNALDEDYCCDRLDVHYHGVVELHNGVSKIEIFLMELSPYCQYINETRCSSPVEYLAYITLPPKQMIFQVIQDSGTLSESMQTARRMQLEIVRKKEEKRTTNLKRDMDIWNLVDFFLKSGCNRMDSNILTRLYKNDPFFASLGEERRKPIIKSALNVSRKIILNSSILTLSERLEISNEYLSPEESARFVKDWCSFQNLDVKLFTQNMIRCLDKKSGNRNSIYLQGARKSGKTYIVQSILDACIYVGNVIVESSAYPFVWEKCVDKRLIAMHEPHFSLVNFDQLDKILCGSGTLIFKHNEAVDYLQPTPVIILASEQEWADEGLFEKIKKRFICCYMNLKTFPVACDKKLHPRWLNILNKAFTGKNSVQSNPNTNNEKKEQKIDGNKNNDSQSSKANEHNDSIHEQSSSNNDSEYFMGTNFSCSKRPMADCESGGERHKKRRWT